MHSRHLLWATLCACALLFSSANAGNWSYDFEGAAPASWTTAGTLEPPTGNSGTFVASLESGYLRLSDPNNAASGGSYSGFGGAVTDVFTDVIVEVDTNVAKDTQDDLGVVARADVSVGNGYFASVDYENGHACISKIAGFSGGADLVCSPNGSLGTGDDHHLVFTATGTDNTSLTLDVFTGGGLVQSLNTVDSSSPYLAGVAGVFMLPKGGTIAVASTKAIDGTFDNASARVVPEPSSVCLLLLGVLGVALGRRSRRS